MRSATDLWSVGVCRGVWETADAVVVGEQAHVHFQLLHRLVLIALLGVLAIGGPRGGLRDVRQQVR